MQPDAQYTEDTEGDNGNKWIEDEDPRVAQRKRTLALRARGGKGTENHELF